jgi:hypothetical protein
MIYKNKEVIGIIILISLIILSLVFVINNYSNKYQEQVNLYNSITDSLRLYKNKDSLNVAKIQVMQTDKESDFLKIKNLTGTNLELQNLIKSKDKKIKDLNTALILKDETVYTDTIRQYYPIGGDTLVFSKSILLDTLNNKWINAIYGFKRGFSYFDLKVYNEYKVTIGYENGTLFKQGTPYCIVTNQNPYTVTKDLRVYQVTTPKQKRFGVSLQTGFGGVYNINSKSIGYGPYMGIGFNYNIILW